jgi:hypothetical protein
LIFLDKKDHAAGVNFTNIIRATFSYESFARSFIVLRFRVCAFLAQIIGAKAAHIMLVKLTPGLHVLKVRLALDRSLDWPSKNEFSLYNFSFQIFLFLSHSILFFSFSSLLFIVPTFYFNSLSFSLRDQMK